MLSQATCVTGVSNDHQFIQTQADEKMINQASYTLTTEEFAKLNGVKAPSVRTRLCTSGEYFGVKPIKLPNGRLLWPAINETSTEK